MRQSCQEAQNAVSQYQPYPAPTQNFSKVKGTVPALLLAHDPTFKNVMVTRVPGLGAVNIGPT